ncbi:MAG: hypothetical protein OXH94_10430 [Rhodospirillales bacterium]|nr:hypothetical protein [Rhodospirillales bacterium]
MSDALENLSPWRLDGDSIASMTREGGMCDQRGIFDLDERYAALKRAAPDNGQQTDKSSSGGKSPLFFKVYDCVQ